MSKDNGWRTSKTGFDYKTPMLIEDDDGTLYTQEEWRNRNK